MSAKAIHTKKRNAIRKYVSVFLLLGCLFILPVFAQTETTSSTLNNLNKILQDLVSLMSWGWVILAALAGKFMTNDWVFGAALHMDVYLRKIRNIMKNFANFALIAFLLGMIIKNLVGKEKINFKDLITKTLIAGVLIQASWFVMGALVDISTVATTAIGSFPSAFMGENVEFDNAMQEHINKIKGVSYTVDGYDMTQIEINNPQNQTNASNDDIMKSILPDANSLGGPLIFLGMSTFRFYEYLTPPNSQTDTETLAVGFSLKAIVLIMYTIGLLLLLIANIVRVAFLRIFIIGSPFLILFLVFKKSFGEGMGKIGKFFSIGSLMDLVFKPVLFMAMMSLILILVVSIQNIMISQSSFELNGVSMSVNTTEENSSATLAVNGVSSVTVNDTLFQSIGAGSKSIFADLILFFLTIFLMRQLIKRSLTTGEGPIQSVMKPITKFLEGVVKNMPVFTVGGGKFSATSIKSAYKERNRLMAQKMGIESTTGRFREAEDIFRGKVESMFGMEQSWTMKDIDTLRPLASQKSDAFFKKTVSLAKERAGGINLDDRQWRPLLEKWLTTNSADLTSTNGRGSETWKGDLDKFLGKDKPQDDEATRKNRAQIHKLLGDWGAITQEGVVKGKTPTYDQIMSLRYHEKRGGT